MARAFPWLASAQPTADVVLDGFKRPKVSRLRLERFPRGADNYHIDVLLGAVLVRAVTAYVNALAREQALRIWGQPAQPFNDAIAQAFRSVIVDHHNAVVKQARSENRLERVQLFELALLKLLLDQVDAALLALRAELEVARTAPSRQHNGQSLHYHQQAVALARESSHMRYRIARHLVQEWMRLSHAKLTKIRKSVLGTSWPLPEVMLANPILQLEGGGDVADFSRVYPMVLQDTETATRANACLLDLCAEWLPAAVERPPKELPAESYLPGANRQDQGSTRSLLETERRVRHLFSQNELADLGSNWMDEPENASALLGGYEISWPSPQGWQDTDIAGLQRHLNREFEQRLRKAELWPAITASYEFDAIYPVLGLIDAETLLFDFLNGKITRTDMRRRLGSLDSVRDAGEVLRRIDQLRKAHRNAGEFGRRQSVARFAEDLLRLRRDYKFAWRALIGMDCIRIVFDERERRLATENESLQVFCREADDPEGLGDLVGHVVIKVDVRGASEIAAQLRQRKLNPASHFSRYFYDPITRSLDRYGANKVVVEGDTVMLSVLEYGGESAERLAVARACCLAVQIIGFVDQMNAENLRLELPPLEVGVGIAYSDEAPTYLYDHGRKVTISSAINRARAMSACHAILRESCSMTNNRGLYVAAPVQGEAEHNDTLVRYNVNGIELDEAAFAELNVELSMRRLSARDKRSRSAEVLYAGYCTDVRGDSQLLVVRERCIKLWIGRQLLDAREDGRRFQEVITDEELIARVAKRLSAAKKTRKLPSPGDRGNAQRVGGSPHER